MQRCSFVGEIGGPGGHIATIFRFVTEEDEKDQTWQRFSRFHWFLVTTAYAAMQIEGNIAFNFLNDDLRSISQDVLRVPLDDKFIPKKSCYRRRGKII